MTVDGVRTFEVYCSGFRTLWDQSCRGLNQSHLWLFEAFLLLFFGALICSHYSWVGLDLQLQSSLPVLSILLSETWYNCPPKFNGRWRLATEIISWSVLTYVMLLAWGWNSWPKDWIHILQIWCAVKCVTRPGIKGSISEIRARPNSSVWCASAWHADGQRFIPRVRQHNYYILLWRLVMESFLWPFSPYRLFNFWRKDVHLTSTG